MSTGPQPNSTGSAKIAITLEASHMEDVLRKYSGKPEIVNTDQGSQFTAKVLVDAVKIQGCQLRMDDRSAWLR